MYETIRTQIKIKLSDKFEAKQIDTILSVVDRVMVDYDVAPKVTAIALVDSSLVDAVKMYLLCRKAEGMCDASISNVSSTLKSFIGKVSKPLKEITTNDIRAYLVWYQTTNKIKPATAEKKREHLNTFFRWCVDEELLTKNPMKKIPVIDAPRSDRRAITEEQLEHCRMACKTLREKALLEVLFSTGARVSEIARLNKSDIDWAEGSIRVFGKNSEYYTVFLNAKAKVALKTYIDSRKDYNKALFITERGYQRLSNHAIEIVIKSIGERAKLDVNLTPHVLRHTMATTALRHGARLEVVQRMLNHKYPSTTQIYAEMCLDEVAIVHRKTVV